jgi:hypothetical protein
MNQYFYKVSREINDLQDLYNIKDNFYWHTGNKNNMWQVKEFDQTYLEKDRFLKKLSKKIPGVLRFYKYPPMCYYRWHIDDRSSYNFNYTFTKNKAFALFQNSHKDSSIYHPAISHVIPLEYDPKHWYLFNADILHSVYNLDTEWRYVLSYVVLREFTDINYTRALEIIEEIKLD